MHINPSSSPSSTARTFPLAAAGTESPASAERNWEDTLDVVLAGSVPIIGAGMNLGYGGMVALLSQKRSLGALALVGGAANLASLPLLASGNYLAAIAAMGVSAATLNHIHHSF